MKRYLPSLILGVCICVVLVSLRPQKQRTFKFSEFGQLPVLLNGRLQPVDSVGRNSLLQLRGKQSVALDKRQKLSATEWLLELMVKPQVADSRKVFRIDHPELLGMLKLPRDRKDFSFNEISSSLEEIEKQAKRVGAVDEKLRNPFEKQVFKLYQGALLYKRIKNSLKPEATEDFLQELKQFEAAIQPGVAAVRSQQAGQQFKQEDFDKILEYLSHYDFMAKVSYPLMIPPLPGDKTDNWENVGTSLMGSVRSEKIHPAVTYYATMASAYHGGNSLQFNQSLDAYRGWLKEHLAPAVKKGGREYFFNRAEPFYKATIVYVLAFLCACLSWFNWSDWLRRSGFYLLVLAWLVHTSGLIFRMVLEGRPPVTNLYSSAIFIGWGAVVLGMILERFYHDGIGTVVGASMGFITQIIAHNLALREDTMIMLQAVLDTNFWLATHVVVVTLGYASTFVAGFLAIIYLIRGLFTTTLRESTSKALGRMVYGIVCFAALFSFVGTVLGGIWADQSWGRFWGWDPKENGALIIVIWNALILHARWGGMIRERGLMNMAIVGNIVTSFSWFGVNMLEIGLHSYGFMDAAKTWLILFVASQVLLIGLGLLPLGFWRSFRNRDVTGVKSTDATATPASASAS